MRLEIHYRLAKEIACELKELKFKLDKPSFLLGNLFPDLIHSYLWLRHEYPVSREFIGKKLERLKKRPFFFSFHLGVLTHYICDYFCYPHSSIYGKGIFHHIVYELRQKQPRKLLKLKLAVESFTINELDKLVGWYERFRPLFSDDREHDFQIAALVSSNFLQAAY
ncbi:MAG: zinc dependent phospholipase C family protein [Treponema sp.]|jgi:hypothetical protein|nr:zinc dependent phospholipase C family protein [Treponema sp.]